jgi:MoaA/NifB/PqqE/SkfB family radical SAM enzyme
MKGLIPYFNALRAIINYQPIGTGLEITHRCNLKCSHCYWQTKQSHKELPDNQMIAFIRKLVARGMIFAIIAGGEPLLRPKVLKVAIDSFVASLVFTNGTKKLSFHPTVWALSLDGPKEIHNKIRGEGVYEQIMENITYTRSPVMVTMTITKQNYKYIRNLIDDIVNNEAIKAINFNFYIPSQSRSTEADKLHFIPLEMRDQIIQDLLQYKKVYGNKIFTSERVGYYFSPNGGFNKWNSLTNCVVSRHIKCYNADGTVMTHCVFGKDVDCSQCGCSLSPLILSDLDGDQILHDTLLQQFPHVPQIANVAVFLYWMLNLIQKFPKNSKYYMPIDFFDDASIIKQPIRYLNRVINDFLYFINIKRLF